MPDRTYSWILTQHKVKMDREVTPGAAKSPGLGIIAGCNQSLS